MSLLYPLNIVLPADINTTWKKPVNKRTIEDLYIEFKVSGNILNYPLGYT